MADDTARRLLESVIEAGEPVAADEDHNEVFCLWCETSKPDDGKRFNHPAACTWSRIRAYLAAQPKDEEPREDRLGIMTRPEPPAPPLIDHEFRPCVGNLCDHIIADLLPPLRCGQPRSHHVQPIPPPPVVHPPRDTP